MDEKRGQKFLNNRQKWCEKKVIPARWLARQEEVVAEERPPRDPTYAQYSSVFSLMTAKMECRVC